MNPIILNEIDRHRDRPIHSEEIPPRLPRLPDQLLETRNSDPEDRSGVDHQKKNAEDSETRRSAEKMRFAELLEVRRTSVMRTVGNSLSSH